MAIHYGSNIAIFLAKTPIFLEWLESKWHNHWNCSGILIFWQQLLTNSWWWTCYGMHTCRIKYRMWSPLPFLYIWTKNGLKYQIIQLAKLGCSLAPWMSISFGKKGTNNINQCMAKSIYTAHLFWTITLSLNSRPLVSNGKNNTQVPEIKTTISNKTIATVWWHPCINPTATRGHTIPPTLPTELASPTPVVLTVVGYICSSGITTLTDQLVQV